MSKSEKTTEAAVAWILGTKRDLIHPVLSINVKHRRQLPRFLIRSMAQAESGAPTDRIPCVVMHQESMHHEHNLVVLRLKDLRDLIIKIQEGEESA